MAKKLHETEVENYAHKSAKRLNIPTAENRSLVRDDVNALKVLGYPRNPDLDPQLVWRGKGAEKGGPLEIAAARIYIQEKIHPRQLIEDLRRQSSQPRPWALRAEESRCFLTMPLSSESLCPSGCLTDRGTYRDHGGARPRTAMGAHAAAW
ncbi:MAG: hypothetical protein JO288_03220 [Hyphomicrobiales bacterium]|nr:hypothetical protein [Hyphomicrobiales bacterium]